jgi:cytochrome c553
MSERFTLLSLKSVDHRAIPGGFGALKSADVAQALSGLDRLSTLFVYCCHIYVGEERSRYLTEFSELRARLASYFKHKVPCRQAKAEKLADCIIAVFSGGQVCTTCNGQSEYRNKSGKLVTCGRCHGSKIMRLKTGELSAIAGVLPDNWKRQYAKEYAAAESLASQIYQTAAAHVAKKL